MNDAQKTSCVYKNKINKRQKHLELANNRKFIHSHRHSIRFGWYLPLNQHIPLTDIVSDEHGCKRRALRLYQKYVAQGSEFEINISYNCRNLIAKYFNNRSNMQSR